jgi:hypothetical protein
VAPLGQGAFEWKVQPIGNGAGLLEGDLVDDLQLVNQQAFQLLRGNL